MIERRIRYPQDKTAVIKLLVGDDNNKGPFNRIADVLVFAAALGQSRNKRVKLGNVQAEPIRQEVFDRQGYDTMMNLLALHADGRLDVLADSDEMVELRAGVFEEYANGGPRDYQRRDERGC